MNRKERINLIQEIVKSLKYNQLIPIESSFPEDKVTRLAESFRKKIVAADVTKDIILDAVFDTHLHPIRDYADAGKFTEEQLNELAEDIEDELSGLPRKYEFIFLMPSSTKPLDTMKLRGKMTLYTVKNPEAQTYKHKNRVKVTGGLRSLLGEQILSPFSIKEGQNILKIETNGVICPYGHIKINTEDPPYLYKVIVAIYDALQAFELISATPSSGLTPFSYYAFEDDHSLKRSFEGDGDDNRYARRRQFREIEYKLGRGYGYASIAIQKILANAKTDKDLSQQQRRLRNGAFWFYESSKTTQNFARVSYIVSAFDALLGTVADKKEVKAEIIAQAIALNLKQEKTIRDEIISLYSLRNDIVHGIEPINALETYSSKGKQRSDLIFSCLYWLRLFLRKRSTAFCSIPD